MIHLKIRFWTFVVCVAASITVCAQTPQIEALPAPSIDSVGLNPGSFKTWGRYPMAPMEKIITRLTQDRSSPALNEMTARVLASSTEYAEQAAADSGLWLALRIKGLFDLGRFEEVVRLVDALPSAQDKQAYLPFYFNALLMQDKLEAACRVSASQNSRNAFWQQADVLCQTFGNDVEKARLAYELWRERHGQETLFSGLISHQLYGTSFQVEQVQSLTPMDAFLIQKLGVKGVVFETEPSFMKPAVAVRMQPGFQNAVNLKVLMQRWQKQKADTRMQTIRLIQLTAYLDVFHPDVRYMYKNQIFDEQTAEGAISPLVVFLHHQTPETITGADILIALALLQENATNLTSAFDILKTAGFEALTEQWMLERIS